MPIYICDYVYLTSDKTAPYIDVAIGGYINLYNKTVVGSKDNMQKGKGGGFFLRSGLGLKINNSTHIGIGYQLMYQDKAALHTAYFKIGI